jgi:hypothetical protein
MSTFCGSASQGSEDSSPYSPSTTVAAHRSFSNGALPSFYLLNATSLAKPNAKQHLFADIQNTNSDIVLVVETWFCGRHNDNELALTGFKLFRRDRNGGRKGGGLAAYVTNSIQCDIWTDVNVRNNEIEIMWLICRCSKVIVIVGLCYHPPAPRYQPSEFVSQLTGSIDVIFHNFTFDLIVIAGDFNSLDTEFLSSDHGFTQLVSGPTHGSHLIDKFFVTRSDLYRAVVCKSIVKTKHKAVLVTPSTDNQRAVSQPCRRKFCVHDTRAHNIDYLRFTLGTFDWTKVLELESVEQQYNAFLNVVMMSMQRCIPSKVVTLRSTDPKYITPVVKRLLIRRNRLRRRGNIARADVLAEKINCLIADVQRKLLSKLSNSNPREMWSAVRSRSSHVQYNGTLETFSPDEINHFFARISTATDYSRAEVTKLYSVNTENDVEAVNARRISAFEVERMLRHLKNTAPGNDNIPAWLYRSCSYELADIVANIFNSTLCFGQVPSSWRTSIVTPIPKVSNPITLTDFRPISVTPILSRVAEKLLVQKWIKPALPVSALSDQFAYKQTGSTNCALIKCFDYVACSLEQNDYVRCLLVDFSKAFDTVDHVLVVRKLKDLGFPCSIVNWVISYLTDRCQLVKIDGCLSDRLPINRGIVQGSGIGPYLYIVMESDLHPISRKNEMFKYADDTNLLVPQHTDATLDIEYNNILQWAQVNKMTLNIGKTKEIVFRRPRIRLTDIQPSFVDIEQVDEVKLLGITLNGKLTFNKHVDLLLALCNQRFYLLKLLRDQGMPLKLLHNVYVAIIVSRIGYCLSAWGGFLTEECKGRINAVFKRAKRFGFTDTIYDVNGLREYADKSLFEQIQSECHCLHHILPPVKPDCNYLRARGHDYILPQCDSSLYRKSFIPRCLYYYL